MAIGTATAILGGAVIGGLMNRGSTNKAVDAQQAASDAANETQRYMFDQQRADTQPYRDAGSSALTQIQALLKNPNSVTKQPGYQFGMQQGVNALENSATSRGMTYSGQQAKALTQFGNDYGSSKIDQTYNRLSNLAGLGQVGVDPRAGANYATQAGNNMIGVGNAQAAGALARGSAYGNALNSTLAYGDRAGWFKGGGSPDPNLSGFGGTAADPWFG